MKHQVVTLLADFPSKGAARAPCNVGKHEMLNLRVYLALEVEVALENLQAEAWQRSRIF